VLQTTALTKSFDTTIALNAVDFSISPGEIVGLIGENGAGKSTLLKLLSGVHSPTSGAISLKGTSKVFNNPRDAIRAGISMVHQELNLIPTLSVAANLFLGKEKHRSGVVDRSTESFEATKLLNQVGANFNAQCLVNELSIAQQQLVEIAKALADNAQYIILDEPTAVLSAPEAEKMFDIIRDLSTRGVGVVYVSHRLSEILALAHRIVVLRDGEKVSETSPANLSEGDLAQLMVGRPLADVFPTKDSNIGEVILDHGGVRVSAGEIIGIGGMVGSGRTELAEQLVGLRPGGAFTNYQAAISNGITYVSEDRKGKGLILDMSVEDNIVLATLKNLRTKTADCNSWIEKLSIKTASTKIEIKSLSGGNQQKVSIAKWLKASPRLIIIDEPTRGVDVGARAEIYILINKLAKGGLACIIISSEISELVGLCSRVMVMREGRIMGELTEDKVNESEIIKLAAGVLAS
jgi:ribose transport system ATP-binding protein